MRQKVPSERDTTPPAVLYRFDDRRTLTLERRYGCEDGTIFFNDAENGVRTQVIGTGRLFGGIYVSSSRSTIVVPAITSPDCSSGGGRVCGMYLFFSLDGGRTFEELNGPWGALNTPKGLAVMDKKLFAIWSDGVESIELVPGKRLSKSRKAKDFTEEPIPTGEVLKRAASPSGETKFECREK